MLGRRSRNGGLRGGHSSNRRVAEAETGGVRAQIEDCWCCFLME